MVRCLYRALLSLHPPEFQEQFGEEMLWIFDETRSGGVTPLLNDVFMSLLRQWFVGYEVWKVTPMIIYWLIQLNLMVGMLFGRGLK